MPRKKRYSPKRHEAAVAPYKKSARAQHGEVGLRCERTSDGLALDELSLYKYRAIRAELKQVEAELEAKKRARAALLEQLDPHGDLAKLDAELGALAHTHELAERRDDQLEHELGKIARGAGLAAAFVEPDSGRILEASAS